MIWELTRAASITGFILMFIAVSTGIIMSYKRVKSGPLVVINTLHNFASLLGVILLLSHITLLLFDKYVKFSIFDVLIPFNTSYMTLEVSLGILAIYIFLIVYLSSSRLFKVLKGKNLKGWKIIHMFSYVAFCMGLYHGLLVGTDSKEAWLQAIYLVTAVIPTILIVLRPILKYRKVDSPNVTITS